MVGINNLNTNEIYKDSASNNYVLESSPQSILFNVTNIIDSHFKVFDSWRIAKILTSNNEKYKHLSTEQLVEQWNALRENGEEVHNQIDSYIKYGNNPINTQAKHAVGAIEELEKSMVVNYSAK